MGKMTGTPPQLPGAPGLAIPAGLSTPGNINLYGRPSIPNPAGGNSTVDSMSFEENGKEILIPKAADGRILSDQQAIDRYHKTGENLGIFDSPTTATSYAQRVHNDYAAGKYNKPTSTPDASAAFMRSGAFYGGR